MKVPTSSSSTYPRVASTVPAGRVDHALRTLETLDSRLLGQADLDIVAATIPVGSTAAVVVYTGAPVLAVLAEWSRAGAAILREGRIDPAALEAARTSQPGLPCSAVSGTAPPAGRRRRHAAGGRESPEVALHTSFSEASGPQSATICAARAIPSSMSRPRRSTSPSVYIKRMSPRSTVTAALGNVAPGTGPRTGPDVASSRTTLPVRARRNSDGGCPADAYASVSPSGSTIATAMVANLPWLAFRVKLFSSVSTRPGENPWCARALPAERNCAMSSTAGRPCPTTSLARYVRPSGSSNVSYQSPPRPRNMACRLVDDGQFQPGHLGGTVRQHRRLQHGGTGVLVGAPVHGPVPD